MASESDGEVIISNQLVNMQAEVNNIEMSDEDIVEAAQSYISTSNQSAKFSSAIETPSQNALIFGTPSAQEDYSDFETVIKKRKTVHQLPPPSDSSKKTICIITRDDKKPLPFNFYNIACKDWPILSLLETNSLERNQKGTLIKATISSLNREKALSESTLKSLTIKDIIYNVTFPRELSPYTGEVIFNLMDIEDRSLLTLSTTDIKKQLNLSNIFSTNTIVSVTKTYPWQPKSLSDPDINSIKTMRIAVEFSESIPTRIFHDHVSLRVFPYVAPPTRCFTCMRYGHGAIGCRRPAICAKCNSSDHQAKSCNKDTNTTTPKCLHCKGAHLTTSVRCPIYKQALQIATVYQNRSITRENASILYANLYSSRNITAANTKQRVITPSPLQTTVAGAAESTRNTSTQSSIPANQPTATSSIITPGQRTPDQEKTKKRQNERSYTPIHLTPLYSQVLDGSAWTTKPNTVGGGSGTIPKVPQQQQRGQCQQSSQHRPPEPNQQEDTQSISSLIKSLITSFINFLIKQLSDPQFCNSPLIASLLTGISTAIKNMF